MVQRYDSTEERDLWPALEIMTITPSLQSQDPDLGAWQPGSHLTMVAVPSSHTIAICHLPTGKINGQSQICLTTTIHLVTTCFA